MTIQYGNSDYTFAKRNFVKILKHPHRMTPGMFYQDRFLDIGTHGMCAFIALSYGERPLVVFAGIILAAWTFMLICKFRSYDVWLRNAYFPKGLSSEQKRIRLELAEDGIREHQGDVVSFAPWKDVSATMIEEDMLVITLSSRQEALVPRISDGISELNLEKIRDEIERRRTLNPPRN